MSKMPLMRLLPTFDGMKIEVKDGGKLRSEKSHCLPFVLCQHTKTNKVSLRSIL